MLLVIRLLLLLMTLSRVVVDELLRCVGLLLYSLRAVSAPGR